MIQLTGMSGSGKSTLAYAVKNLPALQHLSIEIIDGDVYRKTICRDLGFSKEDRCENIRRLGKVADKYNAQNTIAIIAAINPFEHIRQELKEKYNAATVWINCDIKTLTQRDTKGLYSRAFLPEGHPEKITNLTGVNDVYEAPLHADLVINTADEIQEVSVQKLAAFILQRPG